MSNMQTVEAKRKQTPSYLQLPTLEEKLHLFSQVNYKPHEKQMLLHSSRCRYVVGAGGARGGKSMAMGAEIFAEVLFPNRRIWCVSSQYELAEKEFDWALHFLGELPWFGKKAIDFFRVSSAARGSRYAISEWGSFVRTKSTEKPQTLLGESLDSIFLGEASQIKPEPWYRMLEMRLSDRIGRMMAISTPNSDAGLFVDFFNKGQDPNEDDWFSFQFSTYDNPFIDKDELDKAKGRMDEINYREQVLGEFVSRRGKVFDVTPAHIIDEKPENYDNLPVMTGIYGKINNPYCVVFIKFDMSTNTYYICDEIHRENCTVNDLGLDIMKKFTGHTRQAILTDTFNNTLRRELEICRIPAIVNDFEREHKKGKALSRRIQLIQNLLSENTEGQAKIRFLSGCTQTIDSFSRTTWPDSMEDKGREDKEIPLERRFGLAHAASFVFAYVESCMMRWW